MFINYACPVCDNISWFIFLICSCHTENVSLMLLFAQALSSKEREEAMYLLF
jgi:hypothetical protein